MCVNGGKGKGVGSRGGIYVSNLSSRWVVWEREDVGVAGEQGTAGSGGGSWYAESWSVIGYCRQVWR